MPSKVDSRAPVAIQTSTSTSTSTTSNWSSDLSTQDQETLISKLQESVHSRSTLASAQYPMSMGGTFQACPRPRKNKPKRFAVALDCEMVITEVGRECAQLCAVDVLTGEPLLDIGVIPIPRVLDWQKPWSGMDWPRMLQLRAAGRTVKGWQGARNALFKYIDQDTILVGHSLDNDLKSLHLVHSRVVDTAQVTKEAVEEELGGNCGRKWALRKLAAAFLGISIQGKKGGHDCMEDTVTTRKVLLKCLLEPEVMKEWAVGAAEEVYVKGGRVYADTKGYDEVGDFL